jgi:pimeloyl-ACP methyl ester carboxylesterase
VLLAPRDAALTVLGWVWPPAALALAAWALVGARRSLRGVGRWLVTVVLVLLAAASVGATVQDVVAVRARRAHPAPGVLHDVGGHALHLDCRGSGAPTVVLLNGLGEVSASWSRVVEGVEPTTRVCAYDRAGQGWSVDADGPPQDGVAAVEDLRALLAAAGERGPFVLAGHSTGGLYAMVQAARHPADVAGMVLLDSASPDQFTDLPNYPLQYAVMRRAYGILPTLARLGLGPLLTGSALPAEDAATVESVSTTPRAASNSRDELTALPDVLRQARRLTSLGHKPLVVLTSTENAQDTDGWTQAQEHMAALSSDVDHVEVATNHAGVVDTPRGSAASVSAIRSVVAAVRDGSPTS